jgi:hypothetical protein
MDFSRAIGLLDAKRRALGMLAGAGALPAPVLDGLRQAAKENRELLERAVLVQGRIIGLVLQAVGPKPRGYGASGYAARGSAGAVCMRSTA